jgi:hypothetical protein
LKLNQKYIIAAVTRYAGWRTTAHLDPSSRQHGSRLVSDGLQVLKSKVYGYLVVGEPQLVLRGKNRNPRRTELRLYLHTRSRLRAIKLIDGVELLRFPRIHAQVQI